MGLGTNRLTETAANVEFIQQAIEAGIGVIDTAHLYTGGSSERAIGTALHGRRTGAVVATKGGFRPGEGSRQTLGAHIAESLRSLRTDRIELYYLHRVDPETPFAETLETLAEHRANGTIENIGLSAVSVEQIELARKIVPIAAVQNQFNLIDRTSDPVIDFCTDEGIVFVPYFPLHGDHARLNEIARRHDATGHQVILAWLLRRSPQILPIPGTLKIAHLRENLGALDLELSDEEFAALR